MGANDQKEKRQRTSSDKSISERSKELTYGLNNNPRVESRSWASHQLASGVVPSRSKNGEVEEKSPLWV